MWRPITKIVPAFLAGALGSLAANAAHADDVDQATQELIHLDQRVHIMALEFNEGPREAADVSDRRLIDAQGLLGLGRTDEAMALLLDVIVRWPRTPAARDATFLLGDALFDLRDLLSARRYYEKGVSTFTGTKREQRALVRLIEIALHTGDFEHVDRHLDLLAQAQGAALDPAAAYVKAKVLYYRGDLDGANRLFASIAAASAYGWRARYFIGTIMVKRGDLTGATLAYEALVRTAAPDGDAGEIQDLARLALGRISSQQGHPERATAYYQSIPPHSKALAEGLYELGWIFVRSKDLEKAREVFARLLRVQPEGPQAAELKLLLANMRLRQGDFPEARAAFSSLRDELEPTYRTLSAVILRSQADPLFLETLTSRDLGEIDLGAFVPVLAQRWVRADPEVERLLTLARDVVAAQKGVADATATLQRVQGVLVSADRMALFQDLGRVRHGSTEALARLVEIRGRFLVRARRLEQPFLLEGEAGLLDQNAAARAAIERQLGAGFTTFDAHPVLVARMPDPVDELRAVVMLLDGPRNFGIAEAERAARPAVVSGARERAVAARLEEVFQQEHQVHQQVLARVSPAGRRQIDRELELVFRADAAVSQLLALDARLDGEADVRVAAIQDLVADRRRDVADANGRLTVILGEARRFGAILTRVLYTRVADRLYDVIVRADVGLIDVAWAFKDRPSVALRTLLAQRTLEEDALKDGLKRQEADLSKRFAAETAWARELPPITLRKTVDK